MVDETNAFTPREVPVTATARVHGEKYARCVLWSSSAAAAAAAAGGVGVGGVKDGGAQLYSGGWDGAVRFVEL